MHIKVSMFTHIVIRNPEDNYLVLNGLDTHVLFISLMLDSPKTDFRSFSVRCPLM